MKDRARVLRKEMTEPEQRIWYFLRNRRLKGYKFVREYVIGPYIADFVCREKKLIVEIDGSQHLDAVQYDINRTNYLNAQGYRVVRFWNNEVFHHIEPVLQLIVDSLERNLVENTFHSADLLPSSRKKKAGRN